MTKANIAETFYLPSEGRIYDETDIIGGGEIDAQVTLGPMLTKHEMLRLSSRDGNQKIMASIIDDCIIGDMGVAAYDLCLADYTYLLYALRMVTFGSEYEMSAICPYCGDTNEIEISMDDMPVTYYSDIEDKIDPTIKLSSGEVITLKLQTPRMLDTIAAKVREFKRKRKGSKEDPTLLYTICSSIDTIDGEEKNQFELEELVRNLPLGDSTNLLNKIEEINSLLGLDFDIITECETCGSEFVTSFRVNENFFRPNNKRESDSSTSI